MTVTETCDVLLHGLDLALLRLKSLHLMRFFLLTRDAVLIVVAFVTHQLAVVHVHDVGANAIHKVLRVGHHEKNLLELFQVLLEPYDGLDIQVICGFVQQEQRRVGEQCLCKRNTHTPTAREGARGTGLHIRRETKTEQDLCRTTLGGIGIELFETGVHLIEALSSRDVVL